MLNPFVQAGPPADGRTNRTGDEETCAQNCGYTLETAPARQPAVLWVGKLLIRMGQKLTKEDLLLKSAREHA